MPSTQTSPATKPAQIWEGDHTALVHVLWDAVNEGLIPRGTDCDVLARHIRRSEYQWAVQELSAAGQPPMVFTERPGEFCHGERH